jgi:uncharacterized membrane protein
VRALAGTGLALAASALFGVGIVLQATVARVAPADDALHPRLLVRLMRSPRFVVGGVIVVLGWVLHATALLLAPLTLVQPVLASSLVVVLILAAPMLGERATAREYVAVGAIVAGVAGLLVVAPERSAGEAGTTGVAVFAGALGAVALVPVALRGVHRSTSGPAVAAGAGFALSAVATKLLTDGPLVRPGAVLWLAVTALAAAVGGVDEMSALQSRPAVGVVPVVFAVETLLPVIAAPLLFGEHWGPSNSRRAALAAALVAVLAGVVVLSRSRAVAAWMEGV